VKRADLKGTLGVRQRGPQEVDIVALAAPITKYAVTVVDPLAIAYELDKALHLARTGRPGPVWLDIPLDVQAAQVDPGALQRYGEAAEAVRDYDDPILSAQVEQTIELLNSSERPVLLIGNGVRLAGARSALLQLIDLLDVPVLTTWAGADLVWEAHPRFFGKPGIVASRGANFALQNADLLVSVGARLDFATTGFDQTHFARGARRVVVDIDAAELGKLQMRIDVPVCADALAFIEAVRRRAETISPKDRRGWLRQCLEWKERYPVVAPEYWEQTGFVNSYVFSRLLADQATADDLIIPGSSGVAIDTFWLAFAVKEGQRAFSTGGLGAMGFGLPAAIGGCLASGKKRTVSVDGDGGFQLNIQELETVARLQLPLKLFVLNNGGYASIRGTQNSYFEGHLVGCDPSSGLTLPDLMKVGAAYGLGTARITENADLADGIRDVLSRPGPVLCEVVVAPDQVVAPRVSSRLRADGTMVSRPLEDLWPLLDRDELRANMLVPAADEEDETAGRS
jgi:acetolactate synthase-1/2/3 large subunit